MERFKLDSSSIAQTKSTIENPSEGLSKYYSKIKLGKNETNKQIGLTASTTTRVPPSEIDISSTECYCKIVIYEENSIEKRRYYIKQDNGGQLFSPWGMYSEGTSGDFDKKMGKFKWTFQEVAEPCFWQYATFLQTRKDIYLYCAQRLSV